MKRNLFTKAAPGLTLVELMIAVALFTGIMVVTAALFSRSLENQNETIITKDLQEEASFVFQYMKKEMSGAQADLAGCGECSGETYFCAPSLNNLFFRNAQGVCTQYVIAEPVTGIGQLAVIQNDVTQYLTSSKVNLLNGVAFTTDAVADGTLDRAVVTLALSFRSSAKPNAKPLNLQSSLIVPTVAFVCGDSIIDRDTYSYDTVLIGSQCWMAQALRTKSKPDGTCINGGSVPCPDASGSDDGLGRSCYDNDEANCVTDGALYTWAGAMNDATTEGDRGICPGGWHVPTDAEWYELESGLKEVAETCNPARDRAIDCIDAGLELSVGGSSNFEGVWAGNRSGGSFFADRASMGYFISSTPYDGTKFMSRHIGNFGDGVMRHDTTNDDSYSLRCLKD